MRIQVQGKTLEVPDGLTDDQLNEVVETFAASLPKPEQKKPTLAGRIGQELKQGEAEVQEAKKIFSQNPVISGFVQGGQTAEALSNVAGEAISTGIGAGIGAIEEKTGLKIKEPARELGEKILSTKPGQVGLAAAEKGAKSYMAWRKDHLQEALILESTFSLFSALAPASKKAVKPETPLGQIDPGQDLASAIDVVREKFAAVKKKEDDLFTAAKIASIDTSVSGNRVAIIADTVEKLLQERGDSLLDERLAPLADELKKFSRVKSGSVKVDPSGLPIGGEIVPVSIPKVIGIRSNISDLAANPDRKLANAAGKALGEIDTALLNMTEDAILSGNKESIDEMIKAIAFSRQKFKDFGTNTKAGQSNLFEKIITQNPVDNIQFSEIVSASRALSAFGKTSGGKEATPEFLVRLLNNAGDQKEEVRSNLARGYLGRAIKNATIDDPRKPGEKIVNPNRLRSELNALLDDGPKGMGPAKNIVFTKDQIKAIEAFKNRVRSPSGIRLIMNGFALRTPAISGVFTPADIKAARKTGKISEEAFSKIFKDMPDQLRGDPLGYGVFLSSSASEQEQQQ